MNNELAVLYAKRFIQRRDVKAVQTPKGYMPDRAMENPGRHGPVGWEMPHLMAHLEGRATYGHYLLDDADMARFFCFDIDLEKTGFWVPMPPYQDAQNMTDIQFDEMSAPVACNPREIWRDRTAVDARNWLKLQMGMMARKLTGVIQKELGLECAAAYSGNKGIHVYGFTGPMEAARVREYALFALDWTNEWELYKGQHFFHHKIDDPALGYKNFSLEVYPKQDSLEGKDLGNLLRLPLGRNLKSEDPTFFLDLTTPPAVMAPHQNPVQLLETGNPFL